MIRAIAICAAGAGMLLAAPAVAQAGDTPTGGGGDYENTGNSALQLPGERIRRGVERADQDRAAAFSRSGGRAVPAKASEIVAQATVYDLSGQSLGTIETVDADGAVVMTAVGKVKIPLNAFGKNKLGLLVGVSKKDFDAQVMKANSAPVG